ncbi:hypothetical protein LINPERHAP1_LOCUS20262 [Linum perenne]
MRESSERECERGVRGVFASGEGAGGGGSDQVSQALGFRDCSVSVISASDILREHWKLMVTKGSRSHFVLLDGSQLRWIRDVLMVASRNSWSFPSRCCVESARRSVVVSVAWRAGARVLTVLERCRDGKSFYVAVPSDRNSHGWKSVLSTILQAMGDDRQILDSVRINDRIVSSKSYAGVVSNKVFPKAGGCTMVDGEEGLIQVLETGVEDRLEFLKKGLVFRLEGGDGELPDWKRVRAWMVKFWGIPSEADIRVLGDDLWLLCCSSEEEVERILSLKRWELPGYRFRADRWLPRAGTSTVCETRGFSWVKVKGIPLHLRSDAVLRDIAKMLGPQAIFDLWGCSLNEVRVRVTNRTPPPKGIRLQFREEFFWLPVIQEIRLMEAVTPPSGDDKPAGGSPEISALTGGGDGGFGGVVLAVPTGAEGMSGGWMVTCQEKENVGHVRRHDAAEGYGIDSSKSEKAAGGGRNKADVLGQEEVEALMDKLGYGPSLGLLFDGSKEVGNIGGENYTLGPVASNFGPHNLISTQLQTQLQLASKDICCGEFDFNYSPPETFGGVECQDEVGISEVDGDVVLCSREKELETGDNGVGKKVAEEDEVRTCSGEGLTEETEDADITKGEELSLRVAHLLNLSMPGDDGAVIQTVVETARGVYSRRKKSKLEREMQRLDYGKPSSVSDLETGQRDSGYVVPCLSLDEST